jgi:hypothetical protein
MHNPFVSLVAVWTSAAIIIMAGNFDGDDRTYIINERNLTVDKVVTTLISSTNFDVYTSTFNKSHNPGVVLYITPFDQIPSADLCNVKFIYIFFYIIPSSSPFHIY